MHHAVAAPVLPVCVDVVLHDVDVTEACFVVVVVVVVFGEEERDSHWPSCREAAAACCSLAELYQLVSVVDVDDHAATDSFDFVFVFVAKLQPFLQH